MFLSRFRLRLLGRIEAAKRRWIPHEIIGGVLVEYACDASTRATLSIHVKRALLLLEHRAPMWHRRVQQELAYIFLIELGPKAGLAHFKAFTRECEINATPILANAPEWGFIEIAFALVHEAMHGWLSRHGVRAGSDEERRRIEHVCNRAEASLAARVPELSFLPKIVEHRRAAIAETYSTAATAKRRRSYYGALVRGMFGW